MQINIPEILAEITTVFEEYERALVSNDTAVLDRLFWNDERTVRYGAGENLYGFQEIQRFRQERPPGHLERHVPRREITTFGRDFAVSNIEFMRAGSPRLGRQSQTWARMPDGWRVVSAHVSLMV